MYTVHRRVAGAFADYRDAVAARTMLIRAGLSVTSLEPAGPGDDPGTFPALESFAPSLLHDPNDASAFACGTACDSTLWASDPGASDLAPLPHSYGVEARYGGWVVTTITDGTDEQVERAVKILKSHGARV